MTKRGNAFIQKIVLQIFLGMVLANFSSAALADCLLGDVPTIAEITAMIRSPDCQIQSVEDVLVKLPKSMRSHFSLFYRSLSLQGPHVDDYLNPRAILYTASPQGSSSLSRDQDFFLTFNGKSSELGFNTIEILQTNKWAAGPAKIFQFYDIEFPKSEEVRGLQWSDIQSKISISEPNPAKCLGCHGTPARPIFSGYPRWEGSYGSFHLSVDLNEQKGLQDFMSSVAKTPASRYRILDFITPQADNSADDFTDSVLRGLGNTRLSNKLHEINGFRAAQLIQASPEYKIYKYAIAGALLSCDKFPSFFPSAVRQSLEENMNAIFALDTKYSTANIPGYLDLFLQKGYNDFGDVGNFYRRRDQTGMDPQKALWQNLLSSADNSQRMLELIVDTFYRQGDSRTDEVEPKLRYVTEGRGIDIESWFLDLQQPTYREMAQGYFMLGLIAQGQFAELKPLFDGEAWEVGPYCDNLKKQSLASLAQAAPIPKLTVNPFSQTAKPK